MFQIGRSMKCADLQFTQHNCCFRKSWTSAWFPLRVWEGELVHGVFRSVTLWLLPFCLEIPPELLIIETRSCHESLKEVIQDHCVVTPYPCCPRFFYWLEMRHQLLIIETEHCSDSIKGFNGNWESLPHPFRSQWEVCWSFDRVAWAAEHVTGRSRQVGQILFKAQQTQVIIGWT